MNWAQSLPKYISLLWFRVKWIEVWMNWTKEKPYFYFLCAAFALAEHPLVMSRKNCHLLSPSLLSLALLTESLLRSSVRTHPSTQSGAHNICNMSYMWQYVLSLYMRDIHWMPVTVWRAIQWTIVTTIDSKSYFNLLFITLKWNQTIDKSLIEI